MEQTYLPGTVRQRIQDGEPKIPRGHTYDNMRPILFLMLFDMIDGRIRQDLAESAKQMGLQRESVHEKNYEK